MSEQCEMDGRDSRASNRALSRRRWNSAALCFVAATWASAIGCSGNPPVDQGVIVKGKLVNDGKPLEVPNREIGLGRVELQLIAPGAGGELEAAEALPDGSFEFLGPGKGVKPGEYKLVVLQQDKGFGSDMLEGKFNEVNSPIKVSVPADKLGATHDLGVVDLKTYLGQASGS